MKLISFSFYYCKLLTAVWLGFHPTSQPLGIRWRWRFWQHRREVLSKKRKYQ